MVTTVVGLHYSCGGVPPIVPRCVSARTWLQLVNRFCFSTAKLSLLWQLQSQFFSEAPFFLCYFVLFLHLFIFRSPENPTGSLRRCLAWEPQLHPHLLFGIARLPTWLTLQQPNREPQQIHGTNLPLIALSPHQLIKYIKMSTPITRRRLQVLTHTSFSF